MHIRSPIIAWIGVIFVATPVLAVSCWNAWLQTRSTRPLYLPVSLAPGEATTGDLKINLSGQYTLTIEAKKTIPFDSLNCLLGVSTLSEQKCDHASVVKAKWTLEERGTLVDKGVGDTDDIGSWSQDTIEREIGSFWLQRGHSYTIRIESLKDGRALAPTRPHLKVEIHPDFYEGSIFTSYYLLTWSKRVLFVGCVFLGLSVLIWAWQKKGKTPSC